MNDPFSLCPKMTTFAYAFAFASGVCSHKLVFSKGEWDRHAPKILLAHILLSTIIFVAFTLATDRTLAMCLLETFGVSSSFTGGFFTSLMAYRILFHPLRSFPGPVAAGASSFWAFAKQWPDLKFYVKLQSIHNKYGDFVRISKITAVRLQIKS
jgi:hypothetical protein